MAPQKVQCPICDRTVSESDINLHLDLQCPGAAGPSSPTKQPSSPPRPRLSQPSASGGQGHLRSSQGSGRSTETPARPPKPQPTSQSRPVAPPFAGAKRSASMREDHTPNGTEKKPRVNPLTANQPLAERSRPSSLNQYVGQDDLVGPGSLLRARIERGDTFSCILWGPPGSGKTTLARLMARMANADYKELSATSSGAADVRQVFEQAKNGLKLTGRKTVLLVDEIHRFTKPQQDLFLPFVEQGHVHLIGATTENPSFKCTGALLSRCQVFTLSAHTPKDLETIMANALTAIPDPPRLPPTLLPFLAEVADGDARAALNGLELALKVCEMPSYRQTTLDGNDNEADLAKRDERLMYAVRNGLRKGYNRTGEEHYDFISAMHKSLRGSDGSAAMYWLARMLTGGEDPLYIARRLVVVASEDVGLADPKALPLAIATHQACQMIGMPECRINLAHCVAYLAEAPKSTRAYEAYKRAEALATRPPLPPVPLQVRNAPTHLMKKLGYGKEYAYNPDFSHPVTNEYLPSELAECSSLHPNEDAHILRTPEAEARTKAWDDSRLAEWEHVTGKTWEAGTNKTNK